MYLHPILFRSFQFMIFSRGGADISIQPVDLLGLDRDICTTSRKDHEMERPKENGVKIHGERKY